MLQFLQHLRGLGVIFMLFAVPAVSAQTNPVASAQSFTPTNIINTNEYKNECGVVFDQNGNLIPSPTGNIGFIRMPGAQGGNCIDAVNYYGVLQETPLSSGPLDTPRNFGLFVTFSRITKNWFCIFHVCGPDDFDGVIGALVAGFSFHDDHNKYYMSTSYGGENNSDAEMQAIAQTFFSQQTISSLNTFEVSFQNILESQSKWSITSRKFSTSETDKLYNIYEGYVGQPGRFFSLAGTGQTFLWKYPNASPASPVVERCQYKLSVEMLDVRGMVPEGVTNGYTGIIGTNPGGPETSAEIAQSGLVVQDWEVSLWCTPPLEAGSPVTAPAIPEAPTYSFSGRIDAQPQHALREFSESPGMMWLDTGGQIDVNYIGGGEKSEPSRPNFACPHPAPKPKPPYPLYVGNWIPLQITSGIYRGFSLALSVLWDQAIEHPNPNGPNAQSSDIFAWSRVGFSHGYPGVLEGDITSAYSVAQAMMPGLPFIPSAPPENGAWKNPFEVLIAGYVDTNIYARSAFPWAQEILVKLRAGTRLRMALASYANERCKLLNPSCGSILDDGMTDLAFNLTALSPVAQVSIISDKSGVAPFYEGAATFTISVGETGPVSKGSGVAWIEHMGGPNFCTNPSDSVIPAPS